MVRPSGWRAVRRARQGPTRVFDLHAAMGGGALAQTDRLRFAAFDVLLDGKTDMQQAPYPDRVARLEKLLDVGVLLHCARCETVRAPAGAAALFERIVTPVAPRGSSSTPAMAGPSRSNLRFHRRGGHWVCRHRTWRIRAAARPRHAFRPVPEHRSFAHWLEPP